MMITNNTGLPTPIVEAVKNDPYQKRGDISATGLIAPIQQTILKRRHSGQLVEDAADRLWALVGSNFHYILERANVSGEVEVPFLATINGVRVSGTCDLYEIQTLYDYKFTSVYAVQDNEPKPEWVTQLNIYAHLARLSGREVTAAVVVCIFRDWSKLKAKKSDYPQTQSQQLAVPLWPDDQVVSYITERTNAISAAEKLPDAELPPCTDEETWARPEKWAVMKNKNKRAVKLFEDKDEAQKMIDAKNGGSDKYWIEHRPGSRPRCEDYCSVKDYCQQWRSYHEMRRMRYADDN